MASQERYIKQISKCDIILTPHKSMGNKRFILAKSPSRIRVNEKNKSDTVAISESTSTSCQPKLSPLKKLNYNQGNSEFLLPKELSSVSVCIEKIDKLVSNKTKHNDSNSTMVISCWNHHKEQKIENDGIAENEYNVEAIQDYRWCWESCEGLYFVKWIGYPESQNTWEPLEHLECHEKLKEFYALRLKEREKALPGRKRFLEVPPDPRTRFERSSETADKICPPPCMSEVEAFFVKLGPNQKDNAWPQSKLDHQLDLIAKAKKTNNVYEKRRELVKEQIMLRHVKEKRAEQIKNLKEWEEEINAIDRLSRGNAKNAKITLENEYDLEGPPRHMNYINVYKPCQGIIIPDDPPIGCECLDGKCGIGTEKTCCPAFNGHRMSYTQFGRLRVELGTPIYECNKICKCDQDCTNRVVQKGRKVKLCIYRTSNGCGWGVKALERIKKGSFVVEYVGEVITSEEAEERGKTYDAEGRTYLFDLDFNMGDQNPYTVDAAFYGNVSHFINHSCDPNLSIFNVWIDCLDPNLPRLCLFANRDISKNEQLSFDYRQRTGYESADESNPLPVEELHEPTKMECRCGAPQCRKILFG